MLICATALFAAWGWSRLHAQPAPGIPAAAHLPAAAAHVAPPPWDGVQAARLHAALRGAFAPALAGAAGWSLAVDDAAGRTIYADGANHAVAPASVTKLIVAATALDVLGPRFRYRTIFSAQQPVDGGLLAGNLWLAGSGDPSLRTEDVRAGVGVLAHGGLTRITGAVAVDPSALRGPERNPHWDPDDADEDYAAPTNALSIDGDTIESSQAVGGVDEHFWTPVRDVPQYAASILERLLRERGIAVAGPRPVVEPAPLDSIVLWEHRSQPLRALERHMLVFSDNHYAEQLLRTVGGEAGGAPDDAGGLAAERRFLSQRGIPAPGLRIEDGSGLSDGNRVAAITFARLLSDSELRGGGGSLYRLLPLGGKEGTLADYDFAGALGRVRAKSGHLSGVSSLAGYVNTRHHGRIVFAFLIDGSPGDPDAAIVRAVNRLAGF